MGVLCWGHCPARESCGYVCSSLGRLCCVRPCSKGSEREPDPLADAQVAKLSVRRISRIDSEESLDNLAFQEERETSMNHLHPTHGGTHKHKKKISLHKRALKTFMRRGTSSPEVMSEDGNLSEGGLEETYRRNIYFHSNLNSSSDDIDNVERDDTESKRRLAHMLKESRLRTKEMSKSSSPPPYIPLHSEDAILPHPSCRSDYDGSHSEHKSRIRRNERNYGSLFDIPRQNTDSHLTEFSDEEKRDRFTTRSMYGGSRDILHEEELSSRAPSASDWVLCSRNITEEDLDSSSELLASAELGTKKDPYEECFGSITLTVRLVSSKIVGVRIGSVQGLPCLKQKDGGICLEIEVVPGGRTVWLPLPKNQGPKVVVDSDVNIRVSQASPRPQVLRICVWASAKRWKHCSLGNALLYVPPNEQTMTVGIYQHTQINKDIGILEISLESQSHSPSKSAIIIHILDSRFSKSFIQEVLKRGFRPSKRMKRDVWCRISLWSKGHRLDRVTTPKIFFPVTCDPSFRSRSKFHIERSLLPFTTLVIKVLCDKGLGLGEMLLGKLILGPHLYLGIASGNSPPGTLSHWGKALTHSGPVTGWHSLYQ